MATGPNGDIYLTGWTNDRHFPAVHPAQAHLAGGKCEVASEIPATMGRCSDAFVVRLDPSGRKILYSTFLGGTGADYGSRVAVDSHCDAFVVGTTFAPNFPQLHSLTARAGGLDGDTFVTGLGPAGRLRFSTLLGGTWTDRGTGIAIDRAGMVYVTGDTASPDFPLVDPLQSSCWRCGLTANSATHTFVAKLDPRAHRLLYSTYLGGEGYEDDSTAIGVDAAGEATVVGLTESPGFPVAHAFQAALSPLSFNAFVTKLNARGTGLVYSTLLGGTRTTNTSNGFDGAESVAVDATGNTVVSGFSYSTDFPLLHPARSSHPGLGGYFAASFAPDGTLRYSTFLPGEDQLSGAELVVVLGQEGHAVILEPGVQVSILTTDGQEARPGIPLPENLFADGIAAGRNGAIFVCGNVPIQEHHRAPYQLPATQATVVRLTARAP